MELSQENTILSSIMANLNYENLMAFKPELL